MTTSRRVLALYEEQLIGLPYPIRLADTVVAKVDQDSGEISAVAIPDMDGLLAAVALTRCQDPLQLAPEEIKFLRGVLGLRSGALAAALGMPPETYSRWESGKQPMGEYAERVLRLHVAASVADQAPAMGFDPLSITGLRIRHRERPDEWPVLSLHRVRVRDRYSRSINEGWEAHTLAA